MMSRQGIRKEKKNGSVDNLGYPNWGPNWGSYWGPHFSLIHTRFIFKWTLNLHGGL